MAPRLAPRSAARIEQGLAGGGGLRKAVGGAVLTGGALVVDQRLDVGGVLDLRALVVAAPMAGEHRRRRRRCVPHAGRRAPSGRAGRGMGDRIIVQIEADIGRLADRDRDMLEQRRRVVRQRQQAGASSANASRTLRAGSSGQRRSAAGPLHQASAWALRSSRSVKLRAAKKASRT